MVLGRALTAIGLEDDSDSVTESTAMRLDRYFESGGSRQRFRQAFRQALRFFNGTVHIRNSPIPFRCFDRRFGIVLRASKQAPDRPARRLPRLVCTARRCAASTRTQTAPPALEATDTGRQNTPASAHATPPCSPPISIAIRVGSQRPLLGHRLGWTPASICPADSAGWARTCQFPTAFVAANTYDSESAGVLCATVSRACCLCRVDLFPFCNLRVEREFEQHPAGASTDSAAIADVAAVVVACGSSARCNTRVAAACRDCCRSSSCLRPRLQSSLRLALTYSLLRLLWTDRMWAGLHES